MNRKRWVILVFSLLLAIAIWVAIATQEKKVNATEMGASAVYDIELELDSEDVFHVAAKIKVTNDSDTAFEDIGFYFIPNALNPDETSDFYQDSAESEIEEILGTDGVMPYSLENNELLIELHSPLQPGESETIDVGYTLKLPEGGLRLSQEERNFYLAQWYPMLAQFDDGWVIQDFDLTGESYHTGFGEFKVTYRLPQDFFVATSAEDGTVQASSSGTVQGEKIKDFYMALLNPAQWLHETVGVDGTDIRLFMPLDQELLDESAQVAQAAFAFFEETIGVNPFPELDIIGNDGYMEYPNIVEVGADQASIDTVLVHEIAHQWFYFIVGNNPFEDAWLDESITEFASSLFLTDFYGDEAYGFNSAEMAMLSTDPKKYTNLPLSEFSDPEYVSTVYGEAPIRLRDFFAERGGQEEALAFLAAYYTEFQFKFLNTEDFKVFFEGYFEGDQSEFLDSWLK
ncbi:MAG TPA: M1 family metallopeptidase [Planococcus sp. (in: firmicutes)]|nr:M1 family metallopeptidase [Planococcus sp. (in: firmicutes)]